MWFAPTAISHPKPPVETGFIPVRKRKYSVGFIFTFDFLPFDTQGEKQALIGVLILLYLSLFLPLITPYKKIGSLRSPS